MSKLRSKLDCAALILWSSLMTGVSPIAAVAQSFLPSCQSDAIVWIGCIGDFTFSDGARYVGEVRNGQWNGRGTYTGPDGYTYVGEFKDGEKNGQGTMTEPGEKYVGEFKDDKVNGQGTLTGPMDTNTSVNSGTAKEWARHTTWPNGEKYIGAYTGC